MMDMVFDIDLLFQKYFPNLSGEFSLRELQKEITTNVLGGKNTLGIMPTGGGKSLIYWLSGLSLEGITLVISPLIALIDEQAHKIQEQGYEVLTIHGGINSRKQTEILQHFHDKKINPDFIFVSPERIATDGFFEFCIKARKEEIKLLTIDEVHCVSQWGFDFRPFYKRIPFFLDRVFDDRPPILLGLTATINPREVADICKDFKIDKSNIFKDDFLIRGEIELIELKFTDENAKEDKLWKLLDIHRGQKTLVYLYRKYFKRGTGELTAKANDLGFKATNFHGDMSSPERQEIIRQFKNNEIDVIFATNAFGMGIDIPDIRVIIHFMLPESVEQYYQEIGRAARDGKASRAYILHTNKNVKVRKTHFINKSFPKPDQLRKGFRKITSSKIGLTTIKYFQDEEIQKCLSYLLENAVVSIKARGFTNLDIFSEITLPELNDLYESTRKKGFITTIKRNNISPEYLLHLVYTSVCNKTSKLAKGFDKCLIIESYFNELPEEKIEQINESIEEKKKYKYDLLDYLAYILNNCSKSQELHQEVGKYLGVDKHLLNKIHSTKKGDLVRSKSEVIISNLLYHEGIPYEYEKKLFYQKNKWIEPDFTISINGKEIYWEHLGMIGTEKYDNRWLEKMKVYEQYYPEQLRTTYESAILTNSAMDLIEELKTIE